MSKKLCIYHGNCADGFTAAWVVKRKFGDDVEFHAGFYGEEPPEECIDRDVIIVDFSYNRRLMEWICEVARSVLVIDHHKSAEANLKGLDDAFDNTDLVFDMERSGAMLTWDYYNGFKDTAFESPALIDYVQDRDLWKFDLPMSKEYTAAVFSMEYTFDNWDKLAKMPVDTITGEGIAILRKHNKDITEFIKVNNSRRMTIAGHDVPVINVPYTLGSDTCHILCEGEPFAAYYYDLGADRKFGLRSAENGLDVSKIAEKFGGGGHKHASGFVLKDFNKSFKEI